LFNSVFLTKLAKQNSVFCLVFLHARYVYNQTDYAYNTVLRFRIYYRINLERRM